MTTAVPAAADDLRTYVEWGGEAWANLVRIGLDSYLGGSLDGLHVLDIGARSGRMSSLLALRGGNVTGIDVDASFVAGAQAEARRLGVADRVRFVVDDGKLGSIADGSIDVAFTKSVLVLMPDLDAYMRALVSKLRPGGRCVFVENGRGSMLMRVARRVRHAAWELADIGYFTEESVATIREHLSIDLIERRTVPPVYLICGRRPSEPSA